jgi:hypothetical protein
MSDELVRELRQRVDDLQLENARLRREIQELRGAVAALLGKDPKAEINDKVGCDGTIHPPSPGNVADADAARANTCVNPLSVNPNHLSIRIARASVFSSESELAPKQPVKNSDNPTNNCPARRLFAIIFHP